MLGIALIALGIVYTDDLWWLHNYIAIDFVHLSTLIIILGCLSFALSVIGCFCVKSENLKFFHVVRLYFILLNTFRYVAHGFKAFCIN